MTDNEPVLYSVDGHVATLTLNRPDSRNALSADLMQALLAAFDKADSDDNVRALVLTGAGKVFCAGGDLSTMNSEASTLDAHYARERYANLFRAVLKLRKPIIAAVNGHAIGGGLGLVCLCDIAIAADTAKLGTPETSVGLFPMMVTSMLMRNIPRKMALEMMFMGRRITAQRACEIGLLNAVVAPEDFAATVSEWAAQLASVSPAAIRLGREAVNVQDTMTVDQALSYLNAMFTLNLATEDAQEGIQAFLEKRSPRWPGK